MSSGRLENSALINRVDSEETKMEMKSKEGESDSKLQEGINRNARHLVIIFPEGNHD